MQQNSNTTGPWKQRDFQNKKMPSRHYISYLNISDSNRSGRTLGWSRTVRPMPTLIVSVQILHPRVKKIKTPVSLHLDFQSAQLFSCKMYCLLDIARRISHPQGYHLISVSVLSNGCLCLALVRANGVALKLQHSTTSFLKDVGCRHTGWAGLCTYKTLYTHRPARYYLTC